MDIQNLAIIENQAFLYADGQPYFVNDPYKVAELQKAIELEDHNRIEEIVAPFKKLGIEGMPMVFKQLYKSAHQSGKDIHDSRFKKMVEFFKEENDENAVDQFKNFITSNDIDILSNGYLIFYKGVGVTKDGENFCSLNKDEFGYEVKIKINEVVEMPRSYVTNDPENPCAYGHHVGTYEYAKNWGVYVLVCIVHPKDIVSVPNDCDYQKVRVARYIPVFEVDSPLPSSGSAENYIENNLDFYETIFDNELIDEESYDNRHKQKRQVEILVKTLSNGKVINNAKELLDTIHFEVSDLEHNDIPSNIGEILDEMHSKSNNQFMSVRKIKELADYIENNYNDVYFAFQ